MIRMETRRCCENCLHARNSVQLECVAYERDAPTVHGPDGETFRPPLSVASEWTCDRWQWADVFNLDYAWRCPAEAAERREALRAG